MKKNIINFGFMAMAVILSAGVWSDSALSVETYNTQILASGAEGIGSGTSVKFSPDGEMFVVDAMGNKILKMDPRTGKILEILPGEGIGGPCDLAFDSNGTMYWANPVQKNIWKRTPDGVTTRIATLHNTIDGIAVNAQGRVFTASADNSKQLWEIDPNATDSYWVVANMGGLDAFDFGPDGYLYGPDFYHGTGNLYKINVDTGEVMILSTGFCAPIAAQVNQEGELYVLDYGGSFMYKVDRLTGEKKVVAEVPAGSDNFDFSPKGEIYVANTSDSFVYKIKKNGKIKNITEPGFSMPGGISIRTDDSGTENIYVGNGWSMRRFDARGEIQEVLDLSSGIIPPFSMYDDGRTLILTCWYLNMVQAYDPVTRSVLEIYPFSQPLNAIRFRGDIIVAAWETGSVVRANDHMPLIEGLAVPVGLAATDQDLWVSDRETGIIWKAVENGQRLNPPLVVATGLSEPEGMTLDHDGSLLVMENGKKRLVSISPSAGDISVIAENLAVNVVVPDTPPTWMAVSGVTVSANGDIYATGDAGNYIYKITRSVR